MASQRAHHPVMDDLRSAAVVLVLRRTGRACQAPAYAGLFFDLAQRGMLFALARLQLALGKGPIVVRGTVDNGDFESAVGPGPHDHAACGSDHLGYSAGAR